MPDVKLDELVDGEIKQRSLKELFAGKKVRWGSGAQPRGHPPCLCLRNTPIQEHSAALTAGLPRAGLPRAASGRQRVRLARAMAC